MGIGSNNLFGGWRAPIDSYPKKEEKGNDDKLFSKARDAPEVRDAPEARDAPAVYMEPMNVNVNVNTDYQSRLIEIQSENINLRKSNDELRTRVLDLEKDIIEKTKILEIILEKDRRTDNALREQQEYVLDSFFDYVDMQTVKLESRRISTNNKNDAQSGLTFENDGDDGDDVEGDGIDGDEIDGDGIDGDEIHCDGVDSC